MNNILYQQNNIKNVYNKIWIINYSKLTNNKQDKLIYLVFRNNFYFNMQWQVARTNILDRFYHTIIIDKKTKKKEEERTFSFQEGSKYDVGLLDLPSRILYLRL